jgi:hypothetical protein
MAYFTDVKNSKCMLQFNKTILRQCSNGFVRIMAKKHLSENPFTSDTSRLLKLVEFMLRRRIQAYHQVTRQWSVFMHRFSAFRRNPQGEQTGNWMMSCHMAVWRVLRKRFSQAVQISNAAGVKAQ